MRIMTTNIWGDYFGNPVDCREDDLYGVYETYKPDIIGFQEVTDGWYKSKLFGKLSENYNFAGTELCNNTNYVPLAISKSFELLSKGYEMLSDTPDVSKAITYAVLKDSNNALFGVCNTHFWWMEGKEHDKIRVKNALQLSSLMLNLSSRYRCPVFAFGDLNCNISSEVFGIFSECGITDLYTLAQKKDDICSHHGDPEEVSPRCYRGEKTDKDHCSSIDHIITTENNCNVFQYRIVEDQNALDATDHSPVYADILLS